MKIIEENQAIHKCIFCLKSDVEFNTAEHIVSESLGNTDDIINGAVCDKCQNYLGREVENFVLSKTPFAFWRTLYGTINKHGKEPFYNTSLDKNCRGKLPNSHPFNDNNVMLHPAYLYDESIIKADIHNDDLLQKVKSGEKTSLNIVLTPKSIVYIGRFLGKIALEYWYKDFKVEVFDKKFNDLRQYVRYGTTSKIWPVIHCNLTDKMWVSKKINDETEEKTLYRYAFYEEKIMGNLLFVFDIGTDRYAIIMDEKYPNSDKFTDEFLAVLLQGTDGEPHILYYDL